MKPRNSKFKEYLPSYTEYDVVHTIKIRCNWPVTVKIIPDIIFGRMFNYLPNVIHEITQLRKMQFSLIPRKLYPRILLKTHSSNTCFSFVHIIFNKTIAVKKNWKSAKNTTTKHKRQNTKKKQKTNKIPSPQTYLSVTLYSPP